MWFPLVWTLFVAGSWAWIQRGDFDRDVKNYSIPVCSGVLLLGLSGWVLGCSGYRWSRRAALALAPWLLVLAFVSAIELQNNGDVGIVGWRWRWAKSPDQNLKVPPTSRGGIEEWKTTPHDYPGFLGGGSWAEVQGVRLATDWQEHAPVERWRCPVGAGWSAFAIVGDYAITQEQRGEQELVVCYRVSTNKSDGEVVWTHADRVRFDPVGAGALGYVGPRATPTIHDGRVLTMGATGIVNCLQATSGKKLWSHDTLSEHRIPNVMWGKASSPVVLEKEGKPTLVIVSVGAPGASLVAYDLYTGAQVWAAGQHRSSYATPVVCELLGERQIVAVNENYVTAHSAVDGAVLWEHPWPGDSDSNATVSQPVPLPPDRVFLSKGYSIGASLLQLGRDANGKIQAEPLWKPAVKNVMKTKMGNVIVRDGYVYGLDGGILECIELETGKKQWKKRRLPAIGHGQIMAVGDTLVISSESGELILADIDPDEYRELASVRVFPEDQITWNNLAFSAPYLLMRNSQQAVCLEMPLRDPGGAGRAELRAWSPGH